MDVKKITASCNNCKNQCRCPERSREYPCRDYVKAEEKK